MLPQTYLDSLTAENCTPDKLLANNIVLAEQKKVLGICHFSEVRNTDEKEWGDRSNLFVAGNMGKWARK